MNIFSESDVIHLLTRYSEYRKHENEQGTGLGNAATGAHDSTTGAGQSHLERDVGIGAAGAGAASILSGPAPNTAGPHRYDWLNKLDPRVDANPDQPQFTGHGPLKVEAEQAGTGTRTADPTHHGETRANDHSDRDAAAVGVLGGAGAYEGEKHHSGTDSGFGVSSTNTTGPHSSNLANKVDPQVESDRSKDHHYGRDAGIADGVGAAAYEVE